MRRVVGVFSAVLAVLGVLALGAATLAAAPALAAVPALGATVPALGAAPVTPEPTPSAGAGAPTAGGTKICTITDPRLIELSGMVATESGYIVVNDGTDVAARRPLFFLDRTCRVTKTSVAFPSTPLDPEDLAAGKDGSLWVADIGDGPGTAKRQTIALWKFSPAGTGAVQIFRMRYPDGPKDAETLVLAADDSPIIIAKGTGNGVSGIYVPTGPLVANAPASQAVALRKVGEFKPQKTGTANPLSGLGYLLVTGGANSRDRTKVALRTYSDAYEWDVPDGDVVKAITTGKARIIPLPGENLGEAIAYTPDGAALLTVPDTANLPGDTAPEIKRYTFTSAAVPTQGPAAQAPRNTLSWYERLSLGQTTALIAAAGVLGIILVVAGVIGIRRSRRLALADADLRRADGEGDVPADDRPTAVMAAIPPGPGYPQPGYEQGYPQGDWSGNGEPYYPEPGYGHQPPHPHQSYPDYR